MRKLVLVVLVLALLLCLAAVASDKMAAKGTDKVTGWVSDEKCGVKGAGPGHEACCKKCIGAGAKPVFVADAEKQIWKVDNPDVFKGHEGHHVAVAGHFDKAKGSVHVESVSMVAEAPATK